MATYAVLTGDIIKSREIEPRARMIRVLKDGLDLVKTRYQADYDLYRGDSFQVVIPSPRFAVLAAIIIRSKLISQSPSKSKMWDARISIGIGEITYRGEKITDSDGPAFLLSGEGMNQLYKKSGRMVIRAPWEGANRNLSLVTRFADNIISSWSHYSGETAIQSLLHKESQNALAERLGISQSAVSSRMATARLNLIKAYIEHVKDHINWETRV